MTFEVNGNIWKIVYCNPSSKNLMRSDGSITLGVCDNSKKCIFLNNRLNRHMCDKVLCHELTHVFSFEYNYLMDIQTEEIVADFMSLFGRDIIYLADSIMNVLARRIA